MFALIITLAAGVAEAKAPVLRQVSSDPYSGGAQHRSEVEPDVDAYGSTIVSAFQIGRYNSGGGSMNTGWATSTDAGKTWKHGELPAFTRASTPAGPYDRTADNTVAYDATHGVWLIASLGIQSGGSGNFRNGALVVSRSGDGLAWSDPIVVSSTLQPDKDWIECDNWPASPGKGTCYAAWSDLDRGLLLAVSASNDGGRTWRAPVATVDQASGYNVQVVVQPNGAAVLVATQGGNVIASHSTDFGKSWSASVVVSGVHIRQVTGGLRVAGAKPSVRVDGRGTVYAVWSDCRFRAGCRSNDLVLSRSSDGARWSRPQRIPIDPVTARADHFLPGLGADPATGGASAHLGLVYYFYRDATCASPCRRLYAGFISSNNGGASWHPPTVLTGPMSTVWFPQTQSGGMVGDYFSTAYVAGRPVTVIASAKAPQRGSLRLAMYSASPPQSPVTARRLVASVGPGRAISISPRSGSPGGYAVVVRDRTRAAGFHLRGPGVNRATGRTFTGTTTWRVTLKRGTYRFFSDARGSRGGHLQIR